jgi:minor extracellular serine protease Vpr
MRTRPRRNSARRRLPLVQAAGLALVATVAAGLASAGPVRGAGESAVNTAAAAWTDLFGDRPEPAAGQRMIVVLAAPSLADRMAQARTTPNEDQQKRWVAEAEAGQRLLVARLAERGIHVTPVHTFSRTINGFSATLDARAQGELERTDGVAGVFPARAVYPAGLSAQALSLRQLSAGSGRRPSRGLPGFDGKGVRIALLDSGVQIDHPSLGGRVQAGVDLVARDQRAAAEPNPSDPTRIEAHGTRMAGILVGSEAPGGLHGLVPAARVFPIRILGWQKAADGSYALMGRGDTLIEGLERAVDPDGDGDISDAARVALAAVVEPYASFPDSPEARAVSGATSLGTLVVAAAGNDGRAGRGFGTVGAPGGAAQALTVGALDTRAEALAVATSLRIGGDEKLASETSVLGLLAPAGRLDVVSLTGPSLADAQRDPDVLADGATLADFFDTKGLSRVAGRAVLLPAGPSLEPRVRNAATAGAAAVLIAGSRLSAGSLDLDETAASPAIALPGDVGRGALDALARGDEVTVTFGGVRPVAGATAGEVAPFSSGGMAFGGHVKPELVAPGVGIATTDAGVNADFTARYATATGSSVSAAIVAGAAAALSQARPGLTVGELRSVLIGSANQILRDGQAVPVTVQGAGVVDASAAAAAELAVEPAALTFGRVTSQAWQMQQTVRIRNLSTRTLEVDFGITRDRADGPALQFSASPSHLALDAGQSATVAFIASGSGKLTGEAGGAFVVTPQGSRPVRVPWAVGFRDAEEVALVAEASFSADAFSPSDSAPSVLSFRVGQVGDDGDGESLEAVQLLVAELLTAKGKPIGELARLHDLLPGRYALGLTGRGPAGHTLRPGRYMLRLRAHPPAGDVNARATVVDVPFTIRP